MKWAALTLLVASCDIVYSLDRPPADAPPPEPGPDEVTATFRRAMLGAAGGAVTIASVPDVSASVVLANGARPEIRREGDDFRFAWTRDMAYELTFERPDHPPLTYVMNTENLLHAERVLAHDGTSPAPGTRLDVTFSNFGAAAALFVMSTGVWATASTNATSVMMLDWTRRDLFLSERPRLLEQGDPLYCAAFDSVTDGVGGLSYDALKRSTSTTMAMANGITPITCEPTTDLPLTDCASMVIDRPMELLHIDAALPMDFGQNWSWSTIVVAVPTPELGPWSGFALAYNIGNGAPVDFTGMLHYGNPFPGHTPAVQTVMLRQRFVYAKGAVVPIDISVGTRQYYAPVANCGVPAVLDETPMPSTPELGGVAFVNDSDLQVSSTHPIEVTWVDKTAGGVDYYLVQLVEIALDGTDTRQIVRHEWITTQKELHIRGDVLEDDHQYAIAITSAWGWSSAATGDFYTTRWPATVATGTNYSGVFTVNK